MIEFDIAGIAIGVFCITLVLKEKNNILQKKLFVAIIALWTLRFCLFYIKSSELYKSFPAIILFDQNLFFLDGVFLYFYTKSLLTVKINRLKASLHLIPFGLACAMSFYTLQNVSSRELIDLFENTGTTTQKPTLEVLIFIGLIILHNSYYLLKGRIHIQKYNKDVLNSYSSISSIQAKWLDNLLVIWLVLFLFPLFLYFGIYSFGIMNMTLMGIAINFSMLISIFVFSYYGIHQEYAQLSVSRSIKLKDAEIDMTNEELEVFRENYEKLNLLMKTNQPYLNPLLRIDTLASLANMTVVEVSNSINRIGNVNFYEFVNSFRMKKIQEELRTTDEQVIQIAYRNGFNSKSAFYDAFKAFNKMTPTQYRKKIRTQK